MVVQEQRVGGISVVVPVLDEARLLPAQLDRLVSLAGFHEVLVVDGGSRDDTVAIAESYATAAVPVRTLRAERGRGVQMNAGARAACGEIVVFLHCDVTLPLDAARTIRRTLAGAEVVAGAFRTWTRPCPTQGRRWLAPLLHLADLRSRYTRLPYGDQALFVWRDEFLRSGGFPCVPLMEDVALARRLRHRGRIRTARSRVSVSGRRFQRSPLRYAVLVNVYPFLFRAGVAPSVLKRWYADVR